MYNSGKQISVRIAFVGGGSLNWAAGLMADLAYDKRLAADVCLYDIDLAAAQRNAEIGSRYRSVSNGTPANYKACETLAEALRDADVVVISILPGTFQDMAQDIGIPEEFGIKQAVGDTVGPGGFVRALRAIPMLANIAKAIREHAPQAYVCNLTNPMSVLTGALHHVFPEIKAWGECHEVTKLRRQVAWLANQEVGEEVYNFRDVDAGVIGINHFTFVNSIQIVSQGQYKDMLPQYQAFISMHAQIGWPQTEPGEDAEHDRYFGTRNLVAFDLFRRYGIPAAAGDRHLAEFLPASDYLSDPERWGFAITPVNYRIRDRANKVAHAEAMRSAEHFPKAKRSDEAIIDQISALMGDDQCVTNVNLPNVGQVEGLSDGSIVETKAIFSKSGFKPINAGRLPRDLEALVAGHSSRQTSLLKAVMTADYAALFPLFCSDPLVSPLDETDARLMFCQMLKATRKWLPDELQEVA